MSSGKSVRLVKNCHSTDTMKARGEVLGDERVTMTEGVKEDNICSEARLSRSVSTVWLDEIMKGKTIPSISLSPAEKVSVIEDSGNSYNLRLT